MKNGGFIYAKLGFINEKGPIIGEFMPIREKLNEMKTASRMTAQEISERSGIPLSTVNRILTGHTDNPTFVTVRDIVKAMGGSLDDLAGIARPEESAALAAVRAELEELRASTAGAHESKALLLKTIDDKSRWLGRVFTYACIVTFLLVVLLAILLIVDSTDPTKGFFWVN